MKDNKKTGVHDSDSLQESGAKTNERQNASTSGGGTADMDHRSATDASGNRASQPRGSGVTTKRTVTGSDFDGQVADQ
jgi:hypothetical protein